ncbi:hypothetical protein Tco_0637297 [Tanacetum coccineum]
MPEDPYAYIMATYEVPPSPDYIPGPWGTPSPNLVAGPEEPEQRLLHGCFLTYCLSHPDTFPESDPLEYPALDYPVTGIDDDEEEEQKRCTLARVDSVPPVHRMTARIIIRDEPSISLPLREEVERLLALITTPITTYSTSSPFQRYLTNTQIALLTIGYSLDCLPIRKEEVLRLLLLPTPCR